jgi:hypothetical protein
VRYRTYVLSSHPLGSPLAVPGIAICDPYPPDCATKQHAGHGEKIDADSAHETWPKIVQDAARGTLKETYAPVDDFGQERKPSLKDYPAIPWDKINLGQFNLVPKMAMRTLQRLAEGWGTFRIIPMESGRGCPYGCEFCTVTGFFGDSIRFRTNERWSTNYFS